MDTLVRRPRIVVAKLPLAGDERGARLTARLLRDAGLEVVYAGTQAGPDGVVEAAIEENADALALCILSGEHMAIVPRVLDLLRSEGAADVDLVVTGPIPAADAAALERIGVTAVPTRGTAIEQVGTILRCEAQRAELCR
jgi:methylmalonyl-CoA mutase C-terminal domain/subunit